MQSTWFVNWREVARPLDLVVGVAVLRRTPYSVLGAATVVDDLDVRVSSQFVWVMCACVAFLVTVGACVRHQESPLSRRYRSSTTD